LEIIYKDQSRYHNYKRRKGYNYDINKYVILKLRDEWFMLEDMIDLSSHKYYKCDQITGLIKCIECIEKSQSN